MILHSAHAELGNKWVAIAQRLPGRTDNCVKNHWNSMLRKRQRREAAMRSAEMAGRSRNAATRPTSLPIPGGIGAPEVSSDLARRATAIAEGRSVPQLPTTNFYDMVHATNPGAFDTLSRGLIDSTPSLSSPITPQRNSKIQIANLVQPHRSKAPPVDSAPPSNDPLASAALAGHNTFAFDNRSLTVPDRNVPPTDPTAITKLHPSVHQPPLQLPTPGFMFSDPSGLPLAADASLANLTSVMNPFARKDDAQAQASAYGASATYLTNTISPVTTPVAGIGPSYPTLDQRMWNSSPFTIADHTKQHQRRPSFRNNTGESSDLTNSMDRSGGGGGAGMAPERPLNAPCRGSASNKMTGGKLGTVKSISKTPIRRGTNGASLAALAQVASSVPPSPLTPESRFSSTSRSASPLPNLAPGDGVSEGGDGTAGNDDPDSTSETRSVRGRKCRKDK